MREVQMAEEAFVQGPCMIPSASQPGGDSGLSKAEDSLSSRKVQPFGKGSEHHGNLVRGSFQPVEGRVVSCTEGGVTGLTAKGLDPLSTAMLAIPDESMD